MPFSDDLIMRFQGYAAKVGIKFSGPDIAPFAIDPADIPDCEKRATPMHKAFYGNQGSTVHKWRGYLDKYDRHLSRFRNTPVRILELGVYRGGSLHLWRTYFGDAATIFGVDIDPACQKYDGIAGHVRIGSQADTTFLQGVVAEIGGVDVVIDDGSHVASHQRASFQALFPLLADKGVYICEDTTTAYARGYYGGGFRRKTNFIEVAKNIADDMNADFHDRSPSVPNAHREISGLHFYQGMIVVEKELQPRPSHMKVPSEA
jgi:23S rRNA U2552 (ribose-2'-O)-methylase RlmE/FtsJ